MKINVTPNTDQIRFYANSALRACEKLSNDLALDNVVSDMRGLLQYLDACDSGDGVVIVGMRKIESGVRIEVSRRNQQVFDLTDRYSGDGNIADGSGNFQHAVGIDIENVRPHGDWGAAEVEIDLAPLHDGQT